MFSQTTQLRVRYAETDQMGMVYYGNYPAYYEVGRVEALRKMGYSYKKLEDSGIMMPVLECHLRYHKPARYDDLLSITAIVKEVPSIKIRFDIEIHNEAGELLNTGYTTLAFVNSDSFRPRRAPQDMCSLLEEFIKS